MGLTRFLAKRAVFLVLTLVLSMYLVVMIANGGGIIDDFLKDSIRFDLNQRLRNDPAYRRLSPENQTIVFNNLYNASLEARGLNEPFLQKSLRYTFDALTLRLGRALEITDSAGSSEVYDIIAERLPRTILLFTTASIISAVFGIWLGLRMARKALSAFDRGMTVISIATVVVPPWVYGILFILIFAYGMDIFPAQGWISVPAPVPGTFGYYTDILWHLALPLAAVTVSSFGAWSYTTRNLVMQIMDEDFVVAARAKGLPERTVMYRYVLRAASPPIVTSLVLTLIASWTGAIITETVFNWPGLGQLFFQAIQRFDPPVIVALTAVYAVLLVITVFLLDLVYGLLDPRVKAMRRA
ncbi:MAG TPA: ABC transporter permease [Thermoplasmata archaeon]|nr:ABC transporter permease [Thermoplasmata archaeon]